MSKIDMSALLFHFYTFLATWCFFGLEGIGYAATVFAVIQFFAFMSLRS